MLTTSATKCRSTELLANTGLVIKIKGKETSLLKASLGASFKLL